MSGERPLPHRPLDRCLSCGSTELKPLPMRYEFRGSYPLVECRACGLRFLAVQPTAEGLAELYGASYFERDFRCGRSAGDSFREEAFREENKALLDEFASLHAPGRLLEVGSAAGWLLKHAAERGWEAQGVELSDAAMEHTRTLGVTVFHGELAAARLPASFFDLVYMGDVLEHVPDCRAVLAEVARVLKPAGHLYIRGPITTNSLARKLALLGYGLAGRTIVLREPPYHLWEFTPRSLERLFRDAGLVVVRLRQSKIPAGRPHGEKSAFQRTVMNTLDTINAPWTKAFNALGDRVVIVGQKR